jgi:hypothetical protein
MTDFFLVRMELGPTAGIALREARSIQKSPRTTIEPGRLFDRRQGAGSVCAAAALSTSLNRMRHYGAVLSFTYRPDFNWNRKVVAAIGYR